MCVVPWQWWEDRKEEQGRNLQQQLMLPTVHITVNVSAWMDFIALLSL